ncbi:cytochrome P450 oxidoreductase [Xylariaceae sp. FL0662B]|nr:cytochrome P450 oxidoreductase [Xylariaceae sp. FL0662B]
MLNNCASDSCIMPSYIAVPVLALLVIYISLWMLLRQTQHPNEPPLIFDSLPFLGPVFAIIGSRHKFYTRTRDKYGHPIYTLRFPGLRLYVVNASSLISIIDRQTQTISFAPIESQATAAVLGTSKTTNEIMARKPGSDQNHFAVFRKTVRPVLARGPSLEAMFKRSFQTMSISLGEQLTLGSSKETKLLAWAGYEITLAGTNAEYGEANPFRDSYVEQAWQKFVAGLPIFVSGFFPSVFARESIQAREYLVERFLRYFRDGRHHLEGSGAVLTRLKHNAAAGMPLADTARGEVGACMALLNNTIPGVFWVIYHIYSDPAVLRDLRHELFSNAVRIDDVVGTHTLDLARVRSACPILQSTVQEVFRFRGIGTGMVRSILEDQILGGQYLLKKGSLLFAPNSVQHFAASLWGPKCDQFDHRRFLRPDGGLTSLKSTSALRIFGGGATYCPGRHFASGQLLVFAAMVALWADIRPVKGKDWGDVKTEKSFGLGIATGFLMPDNDLEVEISPAGNKIWRVELT